MRALSVKTTTRCRLGLDEVDTDALNDLVDSGEEIESIDCCLSHWEALLLVKHSSCECPKLLNTLKEKRL